MKHYTEKQVPARTEKTFIKKTCDLCGAESKRYSDWPNVLYNTSETIVAHRVGNAFPEGGCGSEYFCDLCPDCFWSKLMPWLNEQGCEPHKKEWEF